ncbi:hypothetical protein JYU34_018522 [Plutella xylostella]|uniref:Uncharacterized protein n=1 Tax=Plutella xylostella TaxID=51655 RepID=A0ABQ7PZ60_PLUXY|nr:hypothetical protein JYU34_018522 [Plutella xylostella]
MPIVASTTLKPTEHQLFYLELVKLKPISLTSISTSSPVPGTKLHGSRQNCRMVIVRHSSSMSTERRSPSNRLSFTTRDSKRSPPT